MSICYISYNFFYYLNRLLVGSVFDVKDIVGKSDRHKNNLRSECFCLIGMPPPELRLFSHLNIAGADAVTFRKFT